MSKSTIGVPLPELADYSRIAAAEGAVLLKNENNMLPVLENEVVSVFGRCQFDYYRSGTGSGGAVNVEYVCNIIDGLRQNSKIKLNEELVKQYEEWVAANPADDGGGGWAAEPWHQKEMQLTDELVINARKKSEKALFIIGRTAGEDQDNADAEGGYRLTREEKSNLEVLTHHFEQVAVLLNVANIIDMSWAEDSVYQDHIKAIMYIWQGGMVGGLAVADVISGEVNPSGKLPDTIAFKLEDYPSTSNFGSKDQNFYQEDIYVGYRYFETFAPEKVQYPFGFGLSYTDFEIEILEAKSAGSGADTRIELAVRVKNTGAYAGKEVIQVYSGEPQGVLGKPVKELRAFAKTANLQPKEEETLYISFPAAAMASYDDSGLTGNKSCYVLEAGAYEIFVGNSVRSLTKADIDQNGAYIVDHLTVIETLEEAMAPVRAFQRMKPGKTNSDGTYEIQQEETPLQTISLQNRITGRLPETMPQTGDRGIKLQDVAEGKAEMNAFIAQLNTEELAAIVRGEGMSSPKVTPGTAAAFGGVSDALVAYGIPIACAADGPSGIRMESGLKATQMPIGTLLSSSWNIPMMEELYALEGKELRNNEIDTLLGPGVNIHRNPLNGRNFEYYSEDPYLTGCFASAAVKGIRKSGCVGTVKHFAGNNQEKARFQVDSIISERALREIYLKAFEIAVKEGNATSIMTSYNPVNGHWSASNYDLNTTILRGEWGYQGIVMTDWWAMMNDTAEGGPADRKNTAFMVRAQNDIYMVVNNNGAEVNAMNDNTLEFLEKGSLTVGELQRCAKNICTFLMQVPAFERKPEEAARIQKFAAKKCVGEGITENITAGQTCYLLFELPKITPQYGETVCLKVENPGIFSIVGELSSKGTNQAQATVNMILNGEVMTTVQLNGTDGNKITQKLIKVELEPGYYDLRLDLVKPDMTIGWIEFRG